MPRPVPQVAICVWKQSARTQTPHRPPTPTGTGPLWTPTQFTPRWVGAFSSAQGRPGEPTSLSLLLWVLALRAPHAAPPGLVCPWPEAPTLSREAPLNLSQLCLGMSWGHLGSRQLRSWRKKRENPPHFGYRESCQEMGSSPKWTHDSERESKKVKNPNEASSLSRIFGLDLTEKSAAGA